MASTFSAEWFPWQALSREACGIESAIRHCAAHRMMLNESGLTNGVNTPKTGLN